MRYWSSPNFDNHLPKLGFSVFGCITSIINQIMAKKVVFEKCFNFLGIHGLFLGITI